MSAKAVGNSPPHVPGGDPHATGPFLASQGAQGDQAVPHRAVASDTPAESPRLNALAARAVPNVARDAAPTPQLQSTQTLLQPRTLQLQRANLEWPGEVSKVSRSRKHGHSPSPTTRSVGCKWRDFHMENSGMVNTTLPISSSMFDGFCSPTGSYSVVTEPLPPSITSTPLGQAGPRHEHTTSADSRHLTASRYTSPNFNFPGYPAVRIRSLTPSVPSIAGSHQVSSTWPPSLFTYRPSTPWLTIDQANSIFNLASECQMLSIKLAKEFHVLSGLEAMHRNSIQGTVHKTLTLGRSAREATYSAILWDDITEAECEATTQCLCSEADATWKEMHEVMYNHQLDYDW